MTSAPALRMLVSTWGRRRRRRSAGEHLQQGGVKGEGAGGCAVVQHGVLARHLVQGVSLTLPHSPSHPSSLIPHPSPLTW